MSDINCRINKIISELKHIAINKDIISFDIYDTLIKRDVRHPEDVFYILGQRFINEYKNIDLSPLEFKNIRIRAQIKAESDKSGDEISLAEIYSKTRFSLDEQKWLKSEEEKIEYEISYFNPVIKEFYCWCKENNKQIIAVSDMYLSIEMISRILEKNGYKIKKIFLSSEYNRRKSTGKLFDYIINNEGIDKKRILHIGDAKRGDYIVPMYKGITAKLIPTNIDVLLFPYRSYADESGDCKSIGFYNFLNNRTDISMDKMYLFGFELIGPIVYGYCKWLKKNMDTMNIEHIFFLAREGVLLMEYFLMIYPEEYNKCSVLRVSRRALNNAMIDSGGLQKKNLYEYLKQEGICKDSINAVLADVGWKGTMQQQLSEFIGSELKGFYIGITETINKSNSFGYLFDDQRNPDIRDIIMLTATFFENCFMVNEGTTLAYEKINDKAIPILDDSEQSENSVNVNEKIQNGVRAYIDSAVCSKDYPELWCEPRFVINGYSYYISHVDKTFLKKISFMVSKDNDDECYRIIARHSLLYYCFHPRKLIGDFFESHSKLLFMQSVCKLPVPYVKILGFIRKMSKKNGSFGK